MVTCELLAQAPIRPFILTGQRSRRLPASLLVPKHSLGTQERAKLRFAVGATELLGQVRSQTLGTRRCRLPLSAQASGIIPW